MKPEELELIKKFRGCIGTVVTTGQVESGFARCHEEARSFHDKNGLLSIEYRLEDARLVEAGRDKLAAHMIHEKYDYLVQIDADATFQPDAILRLIHTAFFGVPDSDMVGAYIQLKGPGICAIDTGTGTWEEHYPGEGVIPVIRTGGHFFLTKRSAYEKVGLRGPWFRTREAPRAIDAMAELDGFARQNLSGQNPFAKTSEWQTLLEKATRNGGGSKSGVGEDSSWCDLLKSRGGNIYVDTNIVTGHITKEVIGPDRLKKHMADRARKYGLVCGIY